MSRLEFQTPCIIADLEKVRLNILKMQEAANRFGCALRPHVKTHRSVEIARMQIAAGASGITCAKPSEAEVFANAGIVDIFIAYPLIGESKHRHALSIQRKTGRLIVAADSVEGARALSDFAVSENTVFETRIEIDTGAKRTGAPYDRLREIGAEIRDLPGLDVTGVYTFKSMLLENEVTTDTQAAGAEEGRMMAEAAGILSGLGFHIRDVSAGSTPTGLSVAETGLVNEIRPGTYVFHDWMTQLEGACHEDDIAAYVAVTVVSTPTPELAVIDAGTKTFSADVRLNTPPLRFHGFARIIGRDDLVLDRLNEEHGMIRAANGGATGLRIGETLMLIPAHICTAVNLHDAIVVKDGEAFRTLTVDARGRAW